MSKLTAEPASPAVTPDAITKVATGFMAAKHLFTASGLALFAQLTGGPSGWLSWLSAAASRPGPHASSPTRWSPSASSRRLRLATPTDRSRSLSWRASPEDGLRPFLSFWDQISYPAWMNLDSAARTGKGVGLQLDEAQQRVFSAGVQALTAGAARSQPRL